MPENKMNPRPYFLRDIVPARPKRASVFSVSKNERRVLDLIRRNGAISRADIARETELTPISISRIVENLDRRGFLRFGERVVNGPGKPSTLVHLTADAAYSLGF